MRGWVHIGPYADVRRAWLRNEQLSFDDSDVLAFAWSQDAKNLRAGIVRGRALKKAILGGDDRCVLMHAVPEMADWDHVYRAVALGEAAFTRPS